MVYWLRMLHQRFNRVWFSWVCVCKRPLSKIASRKYYTFTRRDEGKASIICICSMQFLWPFNRFDCNSIDSVAAECLHPHAYGTRTIYHTEVDGTRERKIVAKGKVVWYTDIRNSVISNIKRKRTGNMEQGKEQTVNIDCQQMASGNGIDFTLLAGFFVCIQRCCLKNRRTLGRTGECCTKIS